MSDDKRGDGVLSNLPSTRPQRRSTKRDGPAKAAKAAKAAAARPPSRRAAGAGASDKGARSAGAPSSRSAGGASARSTGAASSRPRAATREPGASQGFEARPPAQITPPSNTDILVSAVRAAGELAEVGLTLGEHLARAAVRRLKP